MTTCSWVATFGIECLTCGFQRSTWLLLHGEIKESFFLFPATIPILLLFLILPAHLLFRFTHGARILTFLFVLSAAFILMNYGFHLSGKEIFHSHH